MILKLESVTRSKGGNRILNGISLNVHKGDFFVLMGPTGCGKTTTLRIAGLLDPPDSGSVLFRGISTRQPERKLLPVRRKMAMVFQSPVMFSGTVYFNIAWGLRIRGIPEEVIRHRVDAITELAGLQGLLERNTESLSGGEQKRVALARAMILEPELLILDEPTTSLHLSFKKELLEKIRELHRETGTTILMATHDFQDALFLGTSGAVMNNGTIEQSGSMESILFNPQSNFMADFTGAGNVIPVHFHGDTAVSGDLRVKHTGNRNGAGCIAIPPEVIVLSTTPGVTSERNRFTGTVTDMNRQGRTWSVTVDVSGTLLDSAVTQGALDELEIRKGSTVYLSFKANAVRVF